MGSEKIFKKKAEEGGVKITYRVRIKNEIPSVYIYHILVCIKYTRKNGVLYSRVPRLRFQVYNIQCARRRGEDDEDDDDRDGYEAV